MLAAILWLSASFAAAQDIQKPGIKGRTSFAVITDSETMSRCRSEILEYKAVLEQEELPVFIVSHTWSDPYEIRTILRKLYDENDLEGCVFIGDIPIPMVTKAQHLTSAFKMDERKHPLRDTSIPTDRFYDDFDLEFIPQGTEPDGLFHYYEMSPTSPQYIECDIYSARIKPLPDKGDKYAQVSGFLKKAVKQHRETNYFDQFVSYTGHGSYSNSLIAWRAEQQLLNEQFGDVFIKENNARFLRFTMEPSMKQAAAKELRREDLDMMVFHEHGLAHRQYLTGEPETSGASEAEEAVKRYLRGLYRRDEKRAVEIAEKFGVGSSWYDNALDPEIVKKDSLDNLLQGIILEDVDMINPNARFVIFDACYNGDFSEDDYIAGRYIFSDGKCVSTFANSVNVLQDKSAFDLLGLLSCGVRIGNWARHINILESHITGDPTFRFTPSRMVDGRDINMMIADENPGFWISYMDHPIPDVQNMAMIKLFNADYPGVSDMLYAKFKWSEYAVVRYNAFRLLEQLCDANFRDALAGAASDSFEFIRRKAVTWMGRVGDDRYIPVMVDTYVNDYNAARITFNIGMSLTSFDKDKVVAAIEERFEGATYYNADKHRKELLKIADPAYYQKIMGGNISSRTLSRAESGLRTIMNRDASYENRKSSMQFLKNQPYNQFVDSFIGLLTDDTEDMQLRIIMAESLAWFRESVHKDRIIAAGRGLLAEGVGDAQFEKELTRMVNRLASPK